MHSNMHMCTRAHTTLYVCVCVTSSTHMHIHISLIRTKVHCLPPGQHALQCALHAAAAAVRWQHQADTAVFLFSAAVMSAGTGQQATDVEEIRRGSGQLSWKVKRQWAELIKHSRSHRDAYTTAIHASTCWHTCAHLLPYPPPTERELESWSLLSNSLQQPQSTPQRCTSQLRAVQQAARAARATTATG
jgi:hypothetical protein